MAAELNIKVCCNSKCSERPLQTISGIFVHLITGIWRVSVTEVPLWQGTFFFISQNKATATYKKHLPCGIVFTTVFSKHSWQLIVLITTLNLRHLFATALHAFIIMSPEVQLYTLPYTAA